MKPKLNYHLGTVLRRKGTDKLYRVILVPPTYFEYRSVKLKSLLNDRVHWVPAETLERTYEPAPDVITVTEVVGSGVG